MLSPSTKSIIIRTTIIGISITKTVGTITELYKPLEKVSQPRSTKTFDRRFLKLGTLMVHYSILVLVIFNRLLQLHPLQVVLPLGYQIQKTPIKDGGFNFLKGYHKAQWEQCMICITGSNSWLVASDVFTDFTSLTTYQVLGLWCNVRRHCSDAHHEYKYFSMRTSKFWVSSSYFFRNI